MLTKEQLDLEILEKEADLAAFRKAYDLIHTRMRATEDSPTHLVTPLYQWSGAVGLKFIMEPLLNNMQHLLDELKALRREQFPDDPVENKQPSLKLVED
jgi:hypothetical protein